MSANGVGTRGRAAGAAEPAASVAHNARVWNHWIGGRDNYTADQQVGERAAGIPDPTRPVAATRFWNAHATPPIAARTRAEIAGFFEGLDLLEPGPVPCSRWRAGTDSPAPVPQFGAVAVKP